MAEKRIGMLQGGGCPGLKASSRRDLCGSEDEHRGHRYPRGWEALTHLNLDDQPASSLTHPAEPGKHAPSSTRRGGPCGTRAPHPIRPK